MMKKTLAVILLMLTSVFAVAAQETFDGVKFTPPAAGGWQRDTRADAAQYTVQNASDRTYAVVAIFRSFVGTDDSRRNFDLSWDTYIKASVAKLLAKPEMSAAGVEQGWRIESGLAPFEDRGIKGVAMLMTATGAGGRVFNIMILTNTSTFQASTTAFVSSIVFPKIDGPPPPKKQQPQSPQQKPSPSPARVSAFKFGTTNFDNGWTAVEERDWVRVTKGAITVLLHYPHPREAETFDQLEFEARTFWDLLVAPRYRSLTNFEVLRSDRDFEPARFAAGNVVEAATGRKLYVALFNKRKRGWVEVVAPDKASFAREFGSININDEIIDWKPLAALADYNKFAVDAADLTGKWTSTFAGTTQYANIYTGSYIGASTSVSSESYIFSAGGGTYSWRVDAATSAGGRTNFAKAQSTGKVTMLNNWQARFSDIEGRPETYDVQFSCIRGARVLWIKGVPFGRVD